MTQNLWRHTWWGVSGSTVQTRKSGVVDAMFQMKGRVDFGTLINLSLGFIRVNLGIDSNPSWPLFNKTSFIAVPSIPVALSKCSLLWPPNPSGREILFLSWKIALCTKYLCLVLVERGFIIANIQAFDCWHWIQEILNVDSSALNACKLIAFIVKLVCYFNVLSKTRICIGL